MVIGAGQNTGLPRLFRVNGHPGKAVVDDRRRCAGVVASRDGLTNGGYVEQVPGAALGRLLPKQASALRPPGRAAHTLPIRKNATPKEMMKITSSVLLVTLAGCAGGTIGVGGFGGEGGVGVGVSAPVGGYGGQAPYVVSEGEQVVQPGMTSSEVVQLLGYPYYRFGVRQDNATIWNYRMRYGSCLIYQVSILPNGIVKDAGTGPDPACDGPNRRRW